MRAFVNAKTGRAVVVKANAAQQNTWRGDIREQAVTVWAGKPPLEGAVMASFYFVMPRPKSAPKRSTPPATKRPDVDKLARAVCDALTSAQIYRDDSQVTVLCARKRIAEIDETAGCRITLAQEVP